MKDVKTALFEEMQVAYKKLKHYEEQYGVFSQEAEIPRAIYKTCLSIIQQSHLVNEYMVWDLQH